LSTAAIPVRKVERPKRRYLHRSKSDSRDAEKAAEAMATNITAMCAATLANDKMRFILASPFTKGGVISPAVLYNATHASKHRLPGASRK
jgi:hypothetical protein